MERETACRVYTVLRQEYGDPGSPRTFLKFENPYQILVLTILSAQTTDRNVNAVRDALFDRYPGPADLAMARQDEVEAIIRSLGFFHAKAAHIIGAARALIERYQGRVPRTMEELLTLPGVGRKTANIVLNHAFCIDEGIAVDTHVRRVSMRLGFSAHPDPERIERDLMELFPRTVWGTLNYLLIRHGRAVCTARNPRCHDCPLRSDCAFFRGGRNS
ncbi:MAG: endonuclease III [Methanolinea sp.]|nr:endonuclease III [Methanolinea sp.]